MSFLAAIAFLTRLPIRRAFSTEEVARASAWFPLIGGVLGFIYGAVWFGATRIAPAWTTAILVLVCEALLTGALHFDGLADMADGSAAGVHAKISCASCAITPSARMALQRLC